jgi:hypothetical protein
MNIAGICEKEKRLMIRIQIFCHDFMPFCSRPYKAVRGKGPNDLALKLDLLAPERSEIIPD